MKWITSQDGTRAEGNLEDRAARYLADQNLLLINADFRAFTDMVDRWKHLYGHVSSSDGVVRDVVREWFEQQLVETVMSAHGLKANGRWSEQELGELLSEILTDGCYFAALPHQPECEAYAGPASR